MEAQEEKLSDNEDHALATNVGKRKGKRKFRSQKEDHSPKRSKKFQKSQKNKKDSSNIKCYGCQKVGHYLRDCPLLKEVKGKMDKRHHAHVVEEEEPVRKKERRTDSDDEYVCIAALTVSVNHEDNTWLIDSGASKHMSGYKETFIDLTMKDSP